MTETDAEFVERIGLDFDLSNTADIQRLFALARRGAEAADRIEQLEEANELMLTDIRRTDVDMLAFKTRIEQLEAELTIQYQDGHHDGYEKGCTISKEASERYDRIDARIEKLEAALREIATYEIEDGCPCSACQHSALARAALGEERT